MARHQDWPGCLGEQTFRSPVQMRGARDRESRAPAAFVSTRHSVVAGVGPGVCLVIGATQAVIVKTAASEMAPSTAKVLSAHACHVIAAQTSDAASAETAEMASAKAAAHVTSATTTMPAAAAACLGISGKKAAGKHGACQNHHHSSSHDFLLLEWAGLSATGSRQTVACTKANASVAMDWRWERLLVLSTKFRFNHRHSTSGSNTACAGSRPGYLKRSAMRRCSCFG